jgi:hypothetical protein
MTTAAVREKLYDYIRIADDKKVKAIYMMLEDEIIKKTEWWKDNAVIDELNNRYSNWESRKDKGYSLEDIEKSIDRLRIKRSKK